ncbi:phosphoglycerate mutase family protein [Trichuris suis]|nr:phosphoglycerate mutase family protein [Trichuris suis]
MVNGRRIRSSLPSLDIFCSGITDLNATNVLQGHTDSPLNSLGRWQASRLGEYFAESGAVFTAAFSSDLIRAVETVQLILEKQPCSNKPVNVQKDPALRERHYGSYEGTKTAKFLAEAKKRGVKPEFYTPDTVEPVPKLAERIENWFQRCWHSARENDSLLVVAHGGSIRRLFAYFYDSLKCEFAAERGRSLLTYLCKVRVVVSGERIRSADKAVLLMNHRTRLDWMFFWVALFKYCPKLLTTGAIILKSSLKNVPGAGWSMQCKNFVFLDRSWNSDKKTLDMSSAYYSSIGIPFQVLVFPEGTNFTAETKERSDTFSTANKLASYDYLLQPRTTGTVHLIREFLKRNSLDCIYDVTVAYPDNIVETEVEFIKGQSPKEVHFHVERYDSVVLASLAKKSDDEMAGWLREIWEIKDKRLRRFLTESSHKRRAMHCKTSFTSFQSACLILVALFWLLTVSFFLYALCFHSLLALLYIAASFMVFSRAVDMEANFTDEVELAYNIEWSGDELKTFHPRTMVVAFGRDADAFMRTYTNPSSMVEICKMNIFRKFVSDETQASKKPCSTITFYKPGSSKALLCCVPSLIDENLSVEVVEQVCIYIIKTAYVSH